MLLNKKKNQLHLPFYPNVVYLLVLLWEMLLTNFTLTVFKAEEIHEFIMLFFLYDEKEGGINNVLFQHYFYERQS